MVYVENLATRLGGPVVGSETILSIFGIVDSTLWRWVKNGKFPPPKKVGGINFWDRDEILEWWRARG